MKNRKIYSIITLIIALILLSLGVHRKEFESYYNKAKMICTQCIGIG